jgi:hypothetical protein
MESDTAADLPLCGWAAIDSLIGLNNCRLRKSACPSVYKSEVVQQRLDGLHARVVAVVASDLSREGLRHPRLVCNQLPARSTGFTKSTLEERDDGFHDARE